MEGVTQRITRSASLRASNKAATETINSSADTRQHTSAKRDNKTRARPHSSEDDDAFEPERDVAKPTKRAAKKRKTNPSTDPGRLLPSSPQVSPQLRSRKKNDAYSISARLFGPDGNLASATSARAAPACLPPLRRHDLAYHRPLLVLDGAGGRDARRNLLAWFDRVAGARGMPWRKPWVDPRAYGNDVDALRRALERRAYEVWISEVMLAQTRVAVVVGYWTRWVTQWPTMQALAIAAPDDVLAAWRGLGYYSRATRIHEAAKLVVADSAMRGLLPAQAAELEAKIPGVGRYTAGAISAIVFGHAAPMVDGNVLRVLSRQLGIFADVKDKAVSDVLWAAADALVKAVAQDGHQIEVENKSQVTTAIAPSDRPGRWGQALMELGSTVCTPKPNCAACPISATCRAYGEGLAFATRNGLCDVAEPQAHPDDAATVDIEDACLLCAPFPDDAGDQGHGGRMTPAKEAELTKQGRFSEFFAASPPNERRRRKKPAFPPNPAADPQVVETIVSHARKFPLRKAKKAVREEETVVCAIRRSTGEYLIRRRPEKGLLAGLWEFPSLVPPSDRSEREERELSAASFSSDFIRDTHGGVHARPELKCVGELGSVPWLFSHLRLTMHVHLFIWEGSQNPSSALDRKLRWASCEAVERESMGTGMRKCWELVKNAV